MKQWIIHYIFKNYFIRRLLPFYGIALMIEVIQKIYLLLSYPHLFDWQPFILGKTFLVAFIETNISFLYMALFLMLYFIAMPVQKQNKNFDKKVTTVLFFFFVFINLLEDFIEISLFRYTRTSFIKASLDQITSLPQEVFAHSFIFGLFLTVALLSFLISLLWRPYLFSRIPSPVLPARLATFFILSGITFLTFFQYNPSKQPIPSNPYNNELARDGFYNIFKELHEIDHLFYENKK